MAILSSIRRQPLVSAVVVLLLVPLVLAAISPALAPIPAATAGWTAPPLPDRDEPLPDFQHLLDPLPLVVRDLPDAESQSVVAIYDRTTYTDNQSAAEMLAAAKAAIPVPSHLERTWNTWLEDPEDRPIPLAVMELLAEDPRNADRLSNLAVAMYFSVFTQADGNKMISSPVSKSLDLLGYTIDAFPESRSPILNRMFIESVTWLTMEEDSRLPDFHNWLVSNPHDATGLQLAVHLYLNSWAPDQALQAELLVGVASQLLDDEDPARVALGHALIGDVYISNLRLGSPVPMPAQSPFMVMQNARKALEQYDTALLYSDDPSIYTARASVLMLLGDEQGSLQSRQRAVDLNPDSMTLRLLLSRAFIEQRGTVEERRTNVTLARDIDREVLEMALASDGVLLSHVQPVSSTRPIHLASSRPERFYVHLAPGMAGGGYAISFTEIPIERAFPLMGYGANPVSQTAWSLSDKSEALGDTDGVESDIILRYALENDVRWASYRRATPIEASAIQASIDQSQTIARLVNKGPDADPADLSEVTYVHRAASWLQIMGEPRKAVELCQAAPLSDCLAESLFVAGDYSASEKAYLDSDNLLYAGYVAEFRRDLDAAEKHYRAGVDSDSFAGYTSTLRLGGVLLERGDAEGAERAYKEWIEWAESGAWAPTDGWTLTVDEVAPYAYSNRGIARLQMLTDRNSSIDCSGDNLDVCTAAAADFDAALASDPYNPVFLMNRAWVARLLGDNEMSSQLMEKALESDSSLYPVLNDMGVLAADNGDSDTAHTYFTDAAAANPDYELAWWNLGVLEMKKGPGGILRGQAYLARAIVCDPSLVTSSLNFKTDESIYRVEITEQVQPGAGWAFGTASSLATSAFGFLGAAFIIFQASRHVLKDKIAEYATTKLDSVRPWIERNVDPVLARLQEWQGYAWGLLALTILVMVLATVVPAWRGDPGAASASITIALFAMLVAVITHELGHRISAAFMKAEIEPVQWGPGVGLSLFLLPINLSSGPFPAQRVKSNDRTTTLWVYLFGPLANLGAALVLYMIYLAQPLPILRVMAITQLVVMSYSLLPFEPLDGAPLSRAQPKLVGALAFFALLAGTLFTVGVL